MPFTIGLTRYAIDDRQIDDFQPVTPIELYFDDAESFNNIIISQSLRRAISCLLVSPSAATMRVHLDFEALFISLFQLYHATL